MPLARVPTSARSSSRSPLPPSPRPPTFLPPSHYAEAGGISPRPRNESVASADTQMVPLETRRSSAFMPISYNSDSSFEFGTRSNPIEQHKRFSISGGGSKSGGGKGASPNPSSSRSKHESRMTNLPLVEAQLLPSLRDTIDRMTRPPSRILASPPADPDPNDFIPASYDSYPTAWSQSPAQPDNLPPVLSPPPSSTPKPLKSALRAPTPKMQPKSPKSPAGFSSPRPAGINPKNNRPNTLASSGPTPGRQRSRTDPGAPPQIVSTSTTSTPKSTPKGSNIPRLRELSGMRSASSTPRPPQRQELAGDDSASDLEMRYELQARDQRSLRVVNGGVTTSESESSCDGESRAGVGLGLELASSSYTSHSRQQSFASRLRARFTGGHNANGPTAEQADAAAERRRKELLGLVKGIDDHLGSQFSFKEQSRDSMASNDNEYAVVVSGSGRVDFGAAPMEPPPRVMVSSSSGDGELDGDRRGYYHARREQERKERPTSLSKRSRSFSPAPLHPPSPSPQVPMRQQQESRAQESGGMRGSSRPPIIRPPLRQTSSWQTDDIPPSSALHRHSVYHNAPPSPSRPTSASNTPKITRYPDEEQYNVLTHSPESVYDEPEDAAFGSVPEEPEPEHLNVRQPEPRFHQRHSDDLANSDTAMLALHSRLAAARDREVLGIPPSASDAGQGEQQRMSYLDSGSSLVRVGQSSWDDGDRLDGGGGGRGLSFGAERLFRTLSGRAVDERGREVPWNGDRSSYAFGQDDILKGRPRPVSIVSQSSSAGSVYDDDDPGEEHETYQGGGSLEEDNAGGEGEAGSTDEPAGDAWRSTIPPITYAAVADRRGPLEIQRQETIYTLYTTEEAFVARLTNTINLFVLPLRLQDSRTYISGVPAEIAKLFDWVEDIRNLHTQLLSALRSVQDGQYPVVERVAEAIRESFVKQLEVYQPYLARLVNVAGTIAHLVADNTSDFGEFVRIQESVRECRGWSLESLLVDPITRLGRYPTIFRKLHECTPKLHADYVPTFALLHSTELVIQVMTEVKIREDEYDLVKTISSRIKGWPPSVPLAVRGRRLLFQGQLLCVPADLHPVPEAKTDRIPPTDPPPFNDRRKPGTRMNTDPKRSTKLVDAIHGWDQRRSRSGSNVSSGTTTTANSYSTTSSAASSEPPSTPSSPHFSSRGSIYLPRPKGSGPSMAQENPIEPRLATETQLVQIFVFTDFSVIASVSRFNGSEAWTLMEDIGVVKILGVSEVSDDADDMPSFLVLDVLPLDIKNLGDPVLSEGVPLKLLHLRVSPSDSSPDKQEIQKAWNHAFRHSLKMTLRSISISGGFLLVPQSADPDADPHQFSAAQRPMPKSPSLIEVHYSGSTNPRRQEREERGWWSSCFCQVLREFQSRDVS